MKDRQKFASLSVDYPKFGRLIFKKFLASTGSWNIDQWIQFWIWMSVYVGYYYNTVKIDPMTTPGEYKYIMSINCYYYFIIIKKNN